MNNSKAPVPWGELVDKITILQTKLANLTSKDALKNVQQECKQLQSIFVQHCPKTIEAKPLVVELKQINQQLWDIGDKIRDKERSLLMMSLLNLLVMCISLMMNVLV